MKKVQVGELKVEDIGKFFIIIPLEDMEVIKPGQLSGIVFYLVGEIKEGGVPGRIWGMGTGDSSWVRIDADAEIMIFDKDEEASWMLLK